MQAHKLILISVVAALCAACSGSSSGGSTGSTGSTAGSCHQLGFSCNADADCCTGTCQFGHCEQPPTTTGGSSGGSSGTSGIGEVVINEISVGADAWMELHNRGTSPVNITGWNWLMTGHNASNPTFNITGSYTFGDVTIPADGYLVFHGGTGTDDASNVYRGSDIGWGVDTGGSSPLAGSAMVTDGRGHDVDFVCWVSLPTGATSTTDWSSTQPVPGFDASMSISRSSGPDTNTPDDWSATAKTEGAPNP